MGDLNKQLYLEYVKKRKELDKGIDSEYIEKYETARLKYEKHKERTLDYHYKKNITSEEYREKNRQRAKERYHRKKAERLEKEQAELLAKEEEKLKSRREAIERVDKLKEELDRINLAEKLRCPPRSEATQSETGTEFCSTCISDDESTYSEPPPIVVKKPVFY